MTALHASARPHLRLVASGTPRLRRAARDVAPVPAVRGGAELPLFHRPASVAILNQDAGVLQGLAGTLPRRWRLRTFMSPDSFLNHLQQEPPRWEADLWAQQELIAQWHAGTELIPLVLRYWMSNPQRHLFTSVAAVDDRLAGQDAVDVLADLVAWPGHKVLMLGPSDLERAVRALNDGLVNAIALKNDFSLRSEMLQVIEPLLCTPHARLQQLWYSTLKPQQLEALRKPGVAQDLYQYLHASFTEWVFLGDPFGVLALDAGGAAYWLQLEFHDQLEELAELSEMAGMSRSDAAQVRRGVRLSNLDLRRALLVPGADSLAARQVGDAPGVLAACTRIDVLAAKSSRSRGREHNVSNLRNHVPALSAAG